MEKLYIEKVPTLDKIAGTNIGNDPKRWSGEILSNLVSSHPYVDTSQVKIKFTRMDPDTTKNAYGVVVVANKATIPFSIRKNDVSDSYELDPLDIVFDGTKLSHLNEVSLNNALLTAQHSTLVDKKDLPSRNQYIGDMTGDVTPLEWSGYPSGAKSVMASTGLLNSVIKNQSSVQRMAYLVSNYKGLNSALEYSGLKDSLASVITRANRIPTQNANMVHLVVDNNGDIAVIFENGDTKYVDIEDLRDALQDDFEYVAAGLNRRKWAIVRDFPIIRDSHIVDGITSTPEVITLGGKFNVMSLEGNIRSLVSTQKNYFDGTNIPDQLAIALDPEQYGTYMQGQQLVGKPCVATEDAPRLGLRRYSGREFSDKQPSYGDSLSRFRTSNISSYEFPVGVVEVGKTGCFIENSFGSPKHTPIFTIKKIIELPNEQPILIVSSPSYNGDIALIIVAGLIRPQIVPNSHYQAMENVLPEQKFYVPGSYIFVELRNKIIPIDKSIVATSMTEPTIILSKNANRYSMRGQSKNDSIQYEMLTNNEVVTKLASLGACDAALEAAYDMQNNSTMKFVNLGITSELSKESSLDLSHIKIAAEEMMQGVNDAAESNPEALSDPSLLSALLSMQFIDDETIEDIIDENNSFIFDQCEDKIAKMLLAARQGKIMIDDRSVEKALKGIGAVRTAIKMLQLKEN